MSCQSEVHLTKVYKALTGKTSPRLKVIALSLKLSISDIT